MKNYLFLVLLFVPQISQATEQTFAEVLYCPDATQKVRLLSTYEADIYNYTTSADVPGNTFEQKIEFVRNQLLGFLPSSSFVTSLKNALPVYNSFIYVEDNLFSVISDEHFTIPPPNCELRQLVIKSQEKFLVSSDLWYQLSTNERFTALLQVNYRLASTGVNHFNRTLAHAAVDHEHLLANLLDLPLRTIDEWNFTSLLVKISDQLFVSFEGGKWIITAYAYNVWSLTTNFGVLSSAEGAGITFRGTNISSIDFVDYNAPVGLFQIQGQSFQILGNSGLIYLYSTGEVCGFRPNRNALLLAEGNISKLVTPGMMVIFNKDGLVSSIQHESICSL